MIPHITGYWEIEKVVNANNEEKNYGINQVIDYFYIDDNLQGFRKKLTPNLNGGYTTTKDSESISITVKDNSIIITSKTLYDQWEETITLANENQMIIVNDLETKYIYKRFESLNIDHE